MSSPEILFHFKINKINIFLNFLLDCESILKAIEDVLIFDLFALAESQV